jgi:hypothetical protein
VLVIAPTLIAPAQNEATATREQQEKARRTNIGTFRP